MVELGLVRLDLGEVAIVKVTGIFQLEVTEDDHAAALVPDGEVLSTLVESDRCDDVRVGHVCCVPLTQSIDINPVYVVTNFVVC